MAHGHSDHKHVCSIAFHDITIEDAVLVSVFGQEKQTGQVVHPEDELDPASTRALFVGILSAPFSIIIRSSISYDITSIGDLKKGFFQR